MRNILQLCFESTFNIFLVFTIWGRAKRTGHNPWLTFIPVYGYYNLYQIIKEENK